MDQSKVDHALAEAKALVSSLEAYDGSAAQHSALLMRTDSIRATLEDPYDIGIRYIEKGTELVALNTLLGLDVFDRFDELPESGSIAAGDLASRCHVDVSVVTRTMRILVHAGIFEEAGQDEYRHNPNSRAFHPTALGGLVRVSSDLIKSLADLPRYLESHKPEDLYDPKKTPFAFTADQEGKTYYDVIDMDPKGRNLWNMALQNMAKVRSEPDRPFIVDIAGGRGQALLAIQEHCAGSYGGKLILQDLPSVINTLKPDETPGIEPMIYDAFTEQPVKGKETTLFAASCRIDICANPGAHVYLMRRFLHDFYNQDVVKLLRNTVSAMAPDSRLVICDMLVPDKVEVGEPANIYWLDLSLLAIGGKERTKDEFLDILNRVGLELVRIYPAKAKGERTVMLETRLKA
ncbi:hypothetical protein N7492_007454 [Penicillium capsulatum]|uniref:O-methyltransferase domain-containing protein n=1 Tax=Penicillium capsulatum TaxID=69766 RepID=A0A9W9LKU9_9EURO|nr:hypothetical protein N7492_007454 [Penicillium capsulatum]KAJ6117287.1 hypothetical protein N7512_007012 [Penicillium capsulatum]